MTEKKDILIARYLSGNCTREEELLLKKWQSENTLHAAELAMAEKLWEVSARLKKNSHTDIDKAWQEFTHLREKPFYPSTKHSFRRTLLRIAALFLLLTAVGFTIRAVFFSTREPQKEERSEVRVQAGRLLAQNIAMFSFHSADSLASVTLPDSSKVVMNKNSSLRYSGDFNKEQRIVYLEGEAFFDVKSNHALPFTVICGEISTKVTGTSFGIRSSANGDVEVSVAHGTVEVSNSKRAGQKLILQQEEKGVFDGGTTSFSKEKTSNKDFKWKEKKQFGKKIKTFIKKIRHKI